MCAGHAENAELIGIFRDFYIEYYYDEIEQLVESYPQKQRSLYVDWRDIYRFDTEIADDYRNQPKRLQEYAEEALRLHDLSESPSLGRANIRIFNLPDVTDINKLESQHRGQLIQLEGWIHNTSDTSPRIVGAAFECQRCGTLTRIPQKNSDLQQPHECGGCERKGPFILNQNQSEFCDFQKAIFCDAAIMTNDLVSTKEIELRLEADIAGMASKGDYVRVVGVYSLEQTNDTSAVYEPHLAAQSIKKVVPPTITASDSWLKDGANRDSENEGDATALEAYVIRSQQVINRSSMMSETNVKAKLVTPLIDLLGWNIYSPEVVFEYPTQSGSAEKRVDYALCIDGVPTVCVEAKSLQKSLDRHVDQLSSYMRQVGADWGLLTNGERIQLLQTDFDAESPNERVVVDCSVGELVGNQDILKNITKATIEV